MKSIDLYESLINFYDNGISNEIPLYSAPVVSYFNLYISEKGKFIKAELLNKAVRMNIPTTLASENRTSGMVSYPLIDTIDYLSGKNDNCFISGLNQMVTLGYKSIEIDAWLNYVKSNTILDDLKCIAENGKINKQPCEKVFPCVYIKSNDDCLPLLNENTYSIYNSYYEDVLSNEEGVENLCIISGELSRSSTLSKNRIIQKYNLNRIFNTTESKKSNNIPCVKIDYAFKIIHSIRYLIDHASIDYNCDVYTAVYSDSCIPMHFMSFNLDMLSDNTKLYRHKDHISIYDQKSNIMQQIKTYIDKHDKIDDIIHILSLAVPCKGKISIVRHDYMMSDVYYKNLLKWYDKLLIDQVHSTEYCSYDYLTTLLRANNISLVQNFEDIFIHDKEINQSTLRAMYKKANDQISINGDKLSISFVNNFKQ